jgi:integrase/recombinase XerD
MQISLRYVAFDQRVPSGLAIYAPSDNRVSNSQADRSGVKQPYAACVRFRIRRPTMTIQPQIDQYLKYCHVERQLSANTLQAYSYDLADFQKWLPSHTEVGGIRTDELRNFLEDMISARGLSVATVRRRIACLRSFFRYLEEGHGLSDPFVGWRLRLPRRKRLPRALSQAETSTLLKWKPLRRQDLSIEIGLMVATGIRVGELCKIQTGDVSPDGSTVRVRGKGSRDRVIYVTNQKLRLKLEALIIKRQRALGTQGNVFVNRYGLPLQPHSFRSKLRSMATRAGLSRRITPHMLRHTAATLLIESGVDIRIVQRLLGHSSIATTEIYTHVSDAALRRTLERADILKGVAV